MSQKTCSYDGRPCPDPRPHRGGGISMCDQNGICQRVSLKDLPSLSFPDLRSPIDTVCPICQQKVIGSCQRNSCQ